MRNAEDKLKLKLPKTKMLENLGQNWISLEGQPNRKHTDCFKEEKSDGSGPDLFLVVLGVVNP